MKKKETKTEITSTEETLKTKRATRTRKKAEAKPAEAKPAETKPTEEQPQEPQPAPEPTKAKKGVKVKEEAKAEVKEKKPAKKRTKKAAAPAEPPKPSEPSEPIKPNKPIEPIKPIQPIEPPKPKPVIIPPMQSVKVRDFTDLANLGGKIPILNDQQIQMLIWDDAQRRCEQLEHILCTVLDYDIVLSDTNIWLELLVGHSSSHSDPRVNARLQFERQLESLSRMMKRIGGRFMVMSETYEEIDRFATAIDPVNYKDADWTDEVLCRNVAARLAKRLMLAQQKENRLRIEGIGSESHHASFADPAIIRRTVELFATGKKVLLLTNDTSVGIRSLGMCDDLQRVNEIDDETWRTVYEPQRPMVLTMDDLKLLDTYTRQYFYLCTAAGRSWMQDATRREQVVLETPLQLWLEGFRPGTRNERKERKEERKEQERKEQERKEQERKVQKAEPQPVELVQQVIEPASAAEPVTEQAATPEEKKSRSRRGRSRRGKKNNTETA